MNLPRTEPSPARTDARGASKYQSNSLTGDRQSNIEARIFANARSLVRMGHAQARYRVTDDTGYPTAWSTVAALEEATREVGGDFADYVKTVHRLYRDLPPDARTADPHGPKEETETKTLSIQAWSDANTRLKVSERLERCADDAAERRLYYAT